MKTNIAKKLNKRVIVLILVGAALLIGGGAVFAYQSLNNKTDDSDSIYSPATPEEKEAGNTQKEKNLDQDKQIDKTKDANGLIIADIVVTGAEQYRDEIGGKNVIETRAYITNVYEENGSCAATYTLNGVVVFQKGEPFKDAKTTQCGAMDIDRSRFPSAGMWQLVVSYESSAAKGKTSPQDVKIE